MLANTLRQLLATATLVLAGVAALAGQAPELSGDPLTNEGVVRASALVDSVFIDRLIPCATAGAGDFASHLMARLGVVPIPADLRFRVMADSQRILLRGRSMDLPAAARAELGGFLQMVPPESVIEAEVTLLPVGLRGVRFHLRTVYIDGVPVPDFILQSVMTEVGRRYPALTSTGRDLVVQIPERARIILTPAGVELLGASAPVTSGP
jgi:hypothetical protein